MQGCDGAFDEREKDIRNHFTNRCSHLYMQLTSATSQAALYQNEVGDFVLCKLSCSYFLLFCVMKFYIFIASDLFPFLPQCEALMRRLAVSDECRSASEQEMDKQREKVNQLRETLQTTSRYAVYFHIFSNIPESYVHFIFLLICE